MYIIFSGDEDKQTNEVMDRLLYYGKEVKRYNRDFDEEEKKELLDILGNVGVKIDSENPPKKRKLAVYHRRPGSKIVQQLIDSDFSEDDVIYPKFEKGSKYFSMFRNNYIGHQVKYFDNVLNNPNYTICKIDYRVNKLDVLDQAIKAGLDIPSTIVSGKKEEVVDFYLKNDKNIITKSAYEIIPKIQESERFWIKTYTQKIENIDELPERFFPTLFQRNIVKKYEIRIFYLDGECYSAAILSQSDPQSQLDFRNENREDRNRIVPYKISEQLKSKIVALMKAVDLNTGSLDFMVGEDGKSYFLEINPVGQFGFINAYCNLGLSDVVAKKMIELHEK